MKIYSKTDIGLSRTVNQDAFYAGEFEGGAVFAVVCVGMGGAKGGNVASEKAATVISDYIATPVMRVWELLRWWRWLSITLLISST